MVERIKTKEMHFVSKSEGLKPEDGIRVTISSHKFAPRKPEKILCTGTSECNLKMSTIITMYYDAFPTAGHIIPTTISSEECKFCATGSSCKIKHK